MEFLLVQMCRTAKVREAITEGGGGERHWNEWALCFGVLYFKLGVGIEVQSTYCKESMRSTM